MDPSFFFFFLEFANIDSSFPCFLLFRHLSADQPYDPDDDYDAPTAPFSFTVSLVPGFQSEKMTYVEHVMKCGGSCAICLFLNRPNIFASQAHPSAQQTPSLMAATLKACWAVTAGWTDSNTSR